jgi:excisionase family DNA binding protein
MQDFQGVKRSYELMEIISADWLTWEEACERIGIKKKTLEEWLRNGLIRSELQRRPGRRTAERVFAAADVERLRKKKQKGQVGDAPEHRPGQLELEPEPGGWVPTPQAAAMLKTSSRSLDRLRTAGKLRRREENGRCFYALSDLQAIAKARGLTLAPPSEKAPAASAELVLVLRELVNERQAERAERERARTESRLWLSLDEAAAYSGLGRLVLRRAIEDQKLTALKAGAWRIRRASLEAFAG